MADNLMIEYVFDFDNGAQTSFQINLDRTNLLMSPASVDEPPTWAALDFKRCPGCELDPEAHVCCPIALNLVQLVETFQDFLSYDQVSVTVKTEERTYSKQTDLQMGLSPLLGIIMVSSGCPIMELLKPNVRFHLPFATLEETAYRSFTMYLLSCFYKQRKGAQVDWSFDGFIEIFNRVSEVNQAFSERLLAASKKDASVNALVNLHCMGEMTTGFIPRILDEMESYFAAYE